MHEKQEIIPCHSTWKTQDKEIKPNQTKKLLTKLRLYTSLVPLRSCQTNEFLIYLTTNWHWYQIWNITSWLKHVTFCEERKLLVVIENPEVWGPGNGEPGWTLDTCTMIWLQVPGPNHSWETLHKWWLKYICTCLYWQVCKKPFFWEAR